MYRFLLELAGLIARRSGRDLRRLRRSRATRFVSRYSKSTGRTFRDTPTSATSPLPSSGQTSTPAAVRGETAQLPLFPADSPASRSALPESGAAREMTAISGRRCCESYARLNPDGYWQKMFLGSCLSSPAWFSRLCYLTWNLRATKFSRWYVQLRARVPRTYDSESLLWPTPRASDNDQGYRGDKSSWKGQNRGETLHNAVKRMWPTPHANASTGPGEHGDGGENLQTVVARMVPTPTSHRTDLGTMEMARYSGRERKAGKPEAQYESVNHGQLNPAWVEWLQGFPVGWTDCEPSETA